MKLAHSIFLSFAVTACSGMVSKKMATSGLAAGTWASAGSTIRLVVGDNDSAGDAHWLFVYDTRGAVSGLSICTIDRAACLADNNKLIGFLDSRTADGYLAYVTTSRVELTPDMKIIAFSRGNANDWQESSYIIRKGPSGFYAEAPGSGSAIQGQNQQSLQPDPSVAVQQELQPSPPNNPLGLSDTELQLVQLTNNYRVAGGLQPLNIDATLMNNTRNWAAYAASRHAANAHSGQNVGENAFHTVASASDCVTGWMNSQHHRDNIMNASYTKIGVAVAYDETGRPYWYQQFIW